MNDDEKNVFEETAKVWLEPTLNAYVPRIELTKVEVVGQTIESSRRRLQDGSSVLVVDLKVTGEFEPTGSFTEEADVGFDNKLTVFVTAGANSEALLDALKNNDDADADYFNSVTTLGLAGLINDGGDTPPGGDPKNNNDIIIIASSVSAGAILMFAAAVYAYTRRRR